MWRVSAPRLALVFSALACQPYAVLVYIDESGHPLPGDAAERPVLLAVCMDERLAGPLARSLYGMKRRLLGDLDLSQEEEEFKAVKSLSRRWITRISPKREFVDNLFDYLRGFDLTVFGIVMERPDRPPHRAPGFLPTQHRWLVERIQRFMEREHPDSMAVLVFDSQDPQSKRALAEASGNFLARSEAGRAMTQMVPSPLFVGSHLTPGIQIADWFAYATRLNHEHHLYQQVPSDAYLSAIRRYARIAYEKVRNYDDADGTAWYGLAMMDKSRFEYTEPTS